MRSIGRAHEMITCLCIAARTSQVPYARCAGEGAPLRVGGSRYLNFVRAACLRVRWDPLVMRGGSLGLSACHSPIEVGLTVTVSVTDESFNVEINDQGPEARCSSVGVTVNGVLPLRPGCSGHVQCTEPQPKTSACVTT